MDACKNLSKNELNSLSDTKTLTAQLVEFSRYTFTVGNLFNPDVNNNIQNKQTKKTNKNDSRNFTKRIICFKQPRTKRRNNKTIRTGTKHNNNMT